MKQLILCTAAGIFLGAMTDPARANTHPCIPSTREELDTIKTNLDKEPWKRGYAVLASDGRPQLTYKMADPFANVSCKGRYDQNLHAWRQDMTAVYSLARMWYFTGNNAYAQKAHHILIAWATTRVSFTDSESGLGPQLGRFHVQRHMAGGAE
jgi:hypothetical protein